MSGIAYQEGPSLVGTQTWDSFEPVPFVSTKKCDWYKAVAQGRLLAGVLSNCCAQIGKVTLSYHRFKEIYAEIKVRHCR